MTNRSNNRDARNPRIRELLDSALRRHQQGRLGQARRIYLKVLKKDPRCATAHHLLGLIDFREGNTVRGIERLQRAVALNPDGVRTRNDLGNMLHEVGNLPESEEQFRAALRWAPEHPDIPSNSIRPNGAN